MASMIALVVLSGCLSKTSQNTEPSVMVQCILAYPQEEQELRLCYTVVPGQETSAPIDDARVILSDLTAGKETGAFSACGEGRWILDEQMMPGHEYRLEVSVPGHSSIHAVTRIPDQYHVHYQYQALSRTFWNDAKREFYSMATSSNMYFSGTRFYADDFGKESLWIFSRIYDPQSGGISAGRRLGTSCFATDPFNLTGEFMDIPEKDADSDDYNKANYLRSLFSRCPYHMNCLRIPEPGNYKWEEIEYFDSIRWDEFCRRQQTYFYVEGDLAEGYEVLPVKTETTSWGELSYVVPSAQLPGQSCLEMMTVSDEYDLYLKDVTALHNQGYVYSNILGGTGIFGARISYYLPWKEARAPHHP